MSQRGIGAVGLAAFAVILVAALIEPLWSWPPTEASGAEVAAAQELRDLSFGVLALSGVPTAICLGAFALIVLRGHVLPRYTAWFAVVGAVAHVAILGTFFARTGFFSLEGFVIVAIPATMFFSLLATSVALVRAR